MSYDLQFWSFFFNDWQVRLITRGAWIGFCKIKVVIRKNFNLKDKCTRKIQSDIQNWRQGVASEGGTGRPHWSSGAIDSMFVRQPTKFRYLKPNLYHMLVFGVGPLESWFVSMCRSQRGSFSSPHWSGGHALSRHWISGALILDFPTFRTMRNNWYCLSHLV